MFDQIEEIRSVKWVRIKFDKVCASNGQWSNDLFLYWCSENIIQLISSLLDETFGLLMKSGE